MSALPVSEQQFSTPRPVRLEVKIPAGDVDVTTVAGEQSTISVQGPEKLLDATTVDQIGDRLIIKYNHKPLSGFRFGRNWGPLRVQVRVPHGSEVELVTASSDATLDGRFGGLEATAASGSVRLTGELDGNAKVRNVSGDVRLPRVTGDLNVQTVSGSVSADAVGGALVANSVSGNVLVSALREGRATVNSVSGKIELGIEHDTSVDVDAGSASGMLHSEIPLAGAPDGGAGPTVVIRGRTVSGDFRLFRSAGV